MELDALLEDIHALQNKMSELEKAYGLLSEDMYALYRLGELEQSRDLIRWVGYYELSQERMRAYSVALRGKLVTLRHQAAGEPIALQPVTVSPTAA